MRVPLLKSRTRGPGRLRHLVLCIAAVALSLGAAAPALAASSSPPAEVVARLPWGPGDGEVGFEDLGGEPWGPSSFDVAVDGETWLVDGVNRRLLVLAADGDAERTVPLPPEVLSPVDIAVVPQGVLLLDLPAVPSRVHLLSRQGALLRSWELPGEYLAENVSGLRVAPGTGLCLDLEVDGSWSAPFLRRGEPAEPSPVAKRQVGNHVELLPGRAPEFAVRGRGSAARFLPFKDWQGWRAGGVRVTDGSREMTLSVRTEGLLAGVSFIECDDAGNAYVHIEETDERSGEYRARVVRYDRQGRPTGECDVPAGGLRTHPSKGVRVTRSGRVLALVPGPDAVSIVEPAWGVPSRAPRAARPAAASRDDGLAGALYVDDDSSSWTKSDANERAWQYIHNDWWCSWANYARDSYDVRPRYITGYNRYWYTTPYCWGGFDLPLSFNTRMSWGDDAGNINCTGGYLSCTAGVDCSGFVSRLWGLGVKHSTSTLDDVSYMVSRTSMTYGDVYLKAGSHVMFFRYFSPGGAAVFESTTANCYDRVVNLFRTSAEVSAPYYPYRYRAW